MRKAASKSIIQTQREKSSNRGIAKDSEYSGKNSRFVIFFNPLIYFDSYYKKKNPLFTTLSRHFSPDHDKEIGYT